LNSSYLQPALLGGLVTGVLSALPIVGAGNVCCCLWVVSGGLLAAYLLQQNRQHPITAADGAIVGLLAGLIGAIIQFALSIPIGILVGPVERQILERLRELSGATASSAPFGMDGAGFVGVVILRIVAFFFTLIVGSVVSTLAGLVGAALFAKSTPAPQPGSSSQ